LDHDKISLEFASYYQEYANLENPFQNDIREMDLDILTALQSSPDRKAEEILEATTEEASEETTKDTSCLRQIENILFQSISSTPTFNLPSSTPLYHTPNNQQPQQPTLYHNSSRFFLEIKHKPRGSQCAWILIEPGQRIRVDKRKGKLMEIVLKFPIPEQLCADSNFYRRLNLKVYLADGNQEETYGKLANLQEIAPEFQNGPVTHMSETDEEKEVFGQFLIRMQLRVRITSISCRQSFVVNLSHPYPLPSQLRLSASEIQVTVNGESEAVVFAKRSVEFCSDDNGRPLHPPLTFSSMKRKRPPSPLSHNSKPRSDSPACTPTPPTPSPSPFPQFQISNCR